VRATSGSQGATRAQQGGNTKTDHKITKSRWPPLVGNIVSALFRNKNYIIEKSLFQNGNAIGLVWVCDKIEFYKVKVCG